MSKPEPEKGCEKMDERMNESGMRLREARGNRPRKEVCEAVGISRSALMMYENGKRMPREPIKYRLAKYYHMTVGQLFYAEK